MLKNHKEKIIKINEEMFKKREASLVNLISGNIITLTNQSLDALSRQKINWQKYIFKKISWSTKKSNKMRKI